MHTATAACYAYSSRNKLVAASEGALARPAAAAAAARTYVRAYTPRTAGRK